MKVTGRPLLVDTDEEVVDAGRLPTLGGRTICISKMRGFHLLLPSPKPGSIQRPKQLKKRRDRGEQAQRAIAAQRTTAPAMKEAARGVQAVSA